MRSLLLALIATAVADGAAGQGELCLHQLLNARAIEIGAADIGGREIKVEIENTADHAIGGAWIDLEIWSSERPRPLGNGAFRDLLEIPGALMPGERMVGLDYHLMDDRAASLAREAEELEVRTSVRNVFDGAMRPALDRPRWGVEDDAVSPHLCRSD